MCAAAVGEVIEEKDGSEEEYDKEDELNVREGNVLAQRNGP